ncbi:MAG: DUF349 domain-containing protein [Bifidobacteriaceae bacterium]|jgi:hypothetical protein|nr:DUF349 domain-containing protein [Bifidobacteriaceae bacterium]
MSNDNSLLGFRNVVSVALPSNEPNARDKAKTYAKIEDGHVYLIMKDRTVKVAEPKDISAETTIEILVNRYFDLADKIALFEARMQQPSMKPKEIDSFIVSIKNDLKQPKCIGNISELLDKISKLEAYAPKRKLELIQTHEQAKKDSLKLRAKLVSEAEAIAAKDYSVGSWGKAQDKLRYLLESWTREQKYGVRPDKDLVDELWHRFISSQRIFEQKRRDFFKSLDAERKASQRTKEAIIAKAKLLKQSTDWKQTADEFKQLMSEWRQAGSAKAKDEAKLWEEFRVTQDQFFAAKKEADQALGGVFLENLTKKRELVEKAKALDLNDPKAARSKLTDIQRKFAAVGHVPKEKSIPLEVELQKISKVIAKAEEKLWNDSDPTKTERQNSFKYQIEQKISRLEGQLSEVSPEEAKSIQEEITQMQSWLKAFQAE